MKSTLYYVHDPMCSWCWAFAPVWKNLREQLPNYIKIEYLLGGLAPDTDTLMPANMQQTIRQTWQRIQEAVPGTQFNFDFWEKCQPRRSTYSACRAVIAARNQDKQHQDTMIAAIQQAYYLDACNPSNYKLLSDLAQSIGLDCNRFNTDLDSQNTHHQLNQEITFSRSIGAQGFPSLIRVGYGQSSIIQLDYLDAKPMLDTILQQ
ncbi:MAG: DsbA family protein [Gammaproteobacteria bacterium]|nr:DsbA family protein [Gammaproteobacteria bacterium]